MLLLTESGASAAFEERLRAVPFLLDNELTVFALLASPSLKSPPVAA
jgi:hypothetical protein